MTNRSTDLNDPATPEDIPQIMRNAAQKMREQTGELQSAWQDAGAGRVWTSIAKELEKSADRIARIAARGY